MLVLPTSYGCYQSEYGFAMHLYRALPENYEKAMKGEGKIFSDLFRF
jgi:hypothetical protein